MVFFKVFNIEDYNEVRGFNYPYFIRFFFGRSSFISKISSIFHLNIHYYSYKAFFLFLSQDVFFPLSMYINDILMRSYSDFYSFKFYSWNGKYFYCRFTDMNIFLDRKSNIGFYNLKDPLRLRLFFSGNCFWASSFLLKGLKLPFVMKSF